MRKIAPGIRETAFTFLALALSWAAHAQTPSPQLLLDRKPGEGPALLVLGTAHFANPGKDMVNTRVENVLSEKRQAEIANVVEQLAAFRPTFVAIEWPETAQARLDTVYGDYRARRAPLNASEHQQIGHGRKATFDALFARVAALSVRLEPDETIGEWLIRMNRPEALLDNHRTYFDIATFGDSESQPGAAWVGTWHARNLRIFANLTRLTPSPQDRILAIYGSGHAYPLRQFAIESNAFRLIDVDQVLKGRGTAP
jgi:hypothetical protein